MSSARRHRPKTASLDIRSGSNDDDDSKSARRTSRQIRRPHTAKKSPRMPKSPRRSKSPPKSPRGESRVYANRRWLDTDARYEMLSELYDRQKHQYLNGFTVGPDVRCLLIVTYHNNNALWEATRGGGVIIRDFQSGDKIREVKNEVLSSKDADKFFVTAMYYDTNSHHVWLGGSDGWLFCYDVSGKTRIHQINEHTAGIRSITGNADEFIWSASEDFTVLQRYTKSGVLCKKFTGHSAWLNSVAVDPIFGWLWSGGDDGIYVWDPEVPDEEDKKDEDDDDDDNDDDDSKSDCVDTLLSGVAVLSLTVVGKNIWCGLKDGFIIVYSAMTRKIVAKKFKAHTQGVHTLCAVNDDVWSASYDKFVNCWSSKTFEKVDSIPLNAEQTPMGKLIKKGQLRVADIVFRNGKTWVGCRSKGSLHSFRVYHPSQSNRINVRIRRPPPQPKRQQPKSPKKNTDNNNQEQLDLLKLTLQQLVDLWNGKQPDEYLRLLHYPEDPLNNKEGVFRIGNRKLRLVAMDGTIMVRVGGGYVTIDVFINNNASHFRTLARIAFAKAKKAGGGRSLPTSKSVPNTATTTTTMTTMTKTPTKTPTKAKKRPSTASVHSNSNNNNRRLGRGEVSNVRQNKNVDVQVLSGKRAWSAKKRGGNNVVESEEIVIDVGEVVDIENKLKQEQRFTKRLLKAMTCKQAEPLLKYIDMNDKELSKMIKKRMKNMKK